MTLASRLAAFKADFESGKPPYKAPRSVVETMHRATAELRATGQHQRIPQPGDKAPTFALQDADGNLVRSEDLLDQGPLVLSFYRGVWCPYCNMDLQALEAELPRIRALGANLLAISPQLPANSRKSQRENKLSFPVLSDTGNAVADAFGLRFALPDYLVELYQAFGNQLPAINGDDSWTLPIPARFIIGRNGVIVYAEADPDYTVRPEPESLLVPLRAAS